MRKLLLISVIVVACGAEGPEAFPPLHTPGAPGSPNISDPPKDEALGIPSEYPQLNARYSAHGAWSVDHSGFEIIPNQVHASTEELPVYQGAQTFGAIWDPDYRTYLIELSAPSEGMKIEIRLSSLEPGTYALSGFDGELEYTERQSYRYTTAIKGGEGTLTIDGNNGVALWGSFSGRACFRRTPGVNCFSLYSGRFSALDQRPQ